MKKYIFLLTLFLANTAFAQQQWAHIKGYDYDSKLGVYGTQGQYDIKNIPGIRDLPAGWSYNGKFYMFGGEGYGSNIFSGYLNDMWVYDTTVNSWQWLKGSDVYGQAGIYGTQLIADPNNIPGARIGATSWVCNGKFYLFGGSAIATNTGIINDLWEYDPVTNNWRWLKGSNANFQDGTYGTQNVSSPSNTPGARQNASGWTYNGKLYLFGGLTTNGHFNDLWLYDPGTNNWTWIKGDSTLDQTGNYGVQNVEAATNLPKSRNGATAWNCNNKLYLFGGNGPLYGTNLNDLWEFNPATNNWTWIKGSNNINTLPVYGQQNVSAPSNNPGGRSFASSWVDTVTNKLYLFGGSGMANMTGALNDFWEYDVSTHNWTWKNGSNLANQKSTIDLLNLDYVYNEPGARYSSQTFTLGNKLFLFAGYGYDRSGQLTQLSDLLEMDLTTHHWIWRKGYNNPSQGNQTGTLNVLSPYNSPSARTQASFWQLNDSGYVYGGAGIEVSTFEDGLWKYNISDNAWTLIKKMSSNDPVYGTPNVADPNNTPGARVTKMTWVYNNILYLFGGQKTTQNNQYYNDFWTYNLSTGEWTWIKGSNLTCQAGTYGTQGVPSPSNNPGARVFGSTFVSNGKLYLFGGDGFDHSGNFGHLNDLWQYDPQTNNWCWLKGDDAMLQYGLYGTLNVPDPANVPGARDNAISWVSNNKLYLFGGFGCPKSNINNGIGYLQDLWQYDPQTNNWCWLKGSNNSNEYGVYGTFNVASPANTPGARYAASGWVVDDTLCLWGGHGYGAWNTGDLNDLWKYNPSSNMWTWVSGNNQPNQPSVVTVENVSSPSNILGSRIDAVSWLYGSKLLIFGGDGYAINGSNANRQDIWYYETCSSLAQCYGTPPLVDIGQDTTICSGGQVLLDAANVGCHFNWSTGDTSQNIVVSTPGVYWVRVTNPNGLYSSDTITLAPGAMPPLVDLGNDTGICMGQYLDLNALNGGCSYLWNNGETSQVINVDTDGIYSVTVFAQNGCIGSDTIVVLTNPLPQVNLGLDNNFCINHPVTLDAQNAGSNFLWNTGQVTQTIIVDSTASYWVVVTDTNNCSGGDTIALNFYPLPVVNLGGDTSVCAGSQITLNAYNANLTNYYWVGGNVTGTVSPSVVDYAYGTYTYIVNVADYHGCQNSDTIIVTAVTNLLPTVDSISGSFINSNTVLFSVVNAQNVISYQWNFGDNSFSAFASPSHVYQVPGTYNVKLYFGNDCSNDSASKLVEITNLSIHGPGEKDVVLDIYPNPASDLVTIKSTNLYQISDAQLIGIGGSVVLKVQQINSREYNLNVGNVSNGAYILRAQINGTYVYRNLEIAK